MNTSTINEFREHGLPYLTPIKSWKTNLVWRTLPVICYLALWQMSVAVLVWLLVFFGSSMLNDEITYFGWFIVISAVSTIAPIFLVVKLFRRSTRLSSSRRKLILFLSYAGLLFGTYANIVNTEFTNNAVETAIFNTITTIVITYLAGWLGLLSIGRWAIKTATSQLTQFGGVMSKVIPISLMVVIFGYFSGEIWQLTDKMTIGRMIGFTGIIVLIAIITALTVAHQELKDHELFSKSGITKKLVPKMNVYFIIACSQIIQGMLFFTVFFTLMLVIAKIVLDPSVAATWLTHPLVTTDVLGIKLPVSVNHLSTTYFVSLLATLTFMVGSATDAEHRSAMFDPIIHNIKAVLAKYSTK